MATNTVRLHRVLRAPPERVYRAFLDADAMGKWLPPNGFTGKVHHLDGRVGGTYKMSFTNFNSGHSHSFEGQYLEVVLTQQPAQRADGREVVGRADADQVRGNAIRGDAVEECGRRACLSERGYLDVEAAAPGLQRVTVQLPLRPAVEVRGAQMEDSHQAASTRLRNST